MKSTNPIIKFQGISKYYGEVRANNDLNFEVQPSTIHAVVGENGAGKSTAMKILAGVEAPTTGKIYIRGKPLVEYSAKEARGQSVGMVYQHFMLSPRHSALDNVLLSVSRNFAGDQKSWLPAMLRFSDRKRTLVKLENLCSSVGFRIPWLQPVEHLSVGVQQQIEIVKLLYAGAEIMIFDEPTAVLSPLETDSFLAMLCRLKQQGKTILLITHKLKEVLQVCDGVTVMRSGTTVATINNLKTSNTQGQQKMSLAQLAELMVGRSISFDSPKLSPRVSDALVLDVSGLSLKRRGKVLLDKISLQVGAGEIVGIAGVEGNGQAELMKVLYLQSKDTALPRTLLRGASYRVMGKSVLGRTTRYLRRLKVGITAADRIQESVLITESLAENNMLGHLDEFSKCGILNRRGAFEHTDILVQGFNVKAPSADALMQDLSGGNQQKFVMARELSRKPSLLLCSEPTRGVDVGSIEQIHGELIKARDKGMGILMVSSQLDELMKLSDRILVMYNGKIIAEFARDSFQEREIGKAMLGVHG